MQLEVSVLEAMHKEQLYTRASRYQLGTYRIGSSKLGVDQGSSEVEIGSVIALLRRPATIACYGDR